MPRIAPVDPEKASPEIRDLLDRVRVDGGEPLRVMATLAHSPPLLRNFMRLGNSILERASLDKRLRELAILRVAQLAGCDYEWAHHVEIGRRVGLSDDDLRALPNWREDSRFDARDRAVLAYAETIARDITVDDATFAAVRAQFNNQELVELTVSIGFYCMIPRILLPLQVENEPKYQKELPLRD